MDRLPGRRPEIGRDGEDAVGADRLRVPRQRHGVLDRERADMDRHRHPPGDNFHGGLGESRAFRNGEAQRLALVVWPRDRGRAGADMEVEHFLEGRKIEAVVILERRDRALHHAAEFVLHACRPKKARHGAIERG